MTKADIVNEIAQKTGREKKAVTECVEAFMETVTEELFLAVVVSSFVTSATSW